MEETLMRVADEVWVALALLHSENPNREDFSEREIKARARKEPWGSILRPGFTHHASYHCLANKAPNNTNHRMLFETERGRRRLFRTGDTFHLERLKGRIRPQEGDLLPKYRYLVGWYDDVYSKQSTPAAAPLSPSVTVPHQFPRDKTSEADTFAGLEEMRSTTAFVGPGGTVVLPDYLQEEFGLKEGSCLSIFRDKDRVVLLPVTDSLIRRLRGSLKGDYSLLEDREREHRIEKTR